MVLAVKQTVTVQPGGVVEVRSPELRAGDRAEVIVLIGDAASPNPPSPLAALDALQDSMRLNSHAAAVWVEQVNAERKAFDPPATP